MASKTLGVVGKHQFVSFACAVEGEEENDAGDISSNSADHGHCGKPQKQNGGCSAYGDGQPYTAQLGRGEVVIALHFRLSNSVDNPPDEIEPQTEVYKAYNVAESADTNPSKINQPDKA